ncbi:MAG: iron-containing redox enzyme family protein [Acidobacteriota bacterium]
MGILTMESSISQNQRKALPPIYLTKAEEQFETVLAVDELDQQLKSRPILIKEFEEALAFSLAAAYEGDAPAEHAHLFLQRLLYRINRLKFFWYDDFSNYKNESSDYLRTIRQRIEAAWQSWELSQMEFPELDGGGVSDALPRRAEVDVAPAPSAKDMYFREQMGVCGYRRLLEIGSLDGLVEASQLSRTLGGVGNKIHSMMTRLLVEEYGGGRLSRKHSSFFKLMLEELDMNTRPEAYFDVVPWEVLATINHSFLLSERKRFYLRYVGGLLYTETSVPAAFDSYRIAAERLGMSKKARAYWELHIKEDERHGRWMLNDIALPLAEMYPAQASEIVLGYDQQKFMSARAGNATAEAVKRADYADRILSTRTLTSYEVAA